MRDKKLAGQVVFLTVSNIIVKFAGLLFKIPMTALIGEEGMGYFNSAYTLFTWFYMVSTAGLPAASAMMISRARALGKYRETRRIFRLSLAIFLCLGIVTSSVMIFGADFFARLMKVERSAPAIIAIAPTLFFICQSAALRGYFQGCGELRPHALSQTAEALGKLALGVALAKYATGKGASPELTAAWAAVGLTIGIAAGMLVLYMSLLFTKRLRNPELSGVGDMRVVDEPRTIAAARSENDTYTYSARSARGNDYTYNSRSASTARAADNSNSANTARAAAKPRAVKTAGKPARQTQPVASIGATARRLVSIALPITLSSSLMSLTGLIDTLIMTRRLHDIGLSQTETIAIYGNYTSLAVPMFNLPPVLIYPLTYMLMPKLAALLERDESRGLTLCRTIVSLTAMISIPAALGLCALSEPILGLLFESEVAERGAMLLTLLAPSSFFVCILALTNTILQASGHERIPLFALTIGSVVKLVSSWALIPVLDKYGTPVSTFLCYFVICTISISAISSRTRLGQAFSPRLIAIPLINSTVAVTLAVIVEQAFRARIGARPAALAAIAIAVAVYLPLTLPRALKLIKSTQEV